MCITSAVPQHHLSGVLTVLVPPVVAWADEGCWGSEDVVQ